MTKDEHQLEGMNMKLRNTLLASAFLLSAVPSYADSQKIWLQTDYPTMKICDDYGHSNSTGISLINHGLIVPEIIDLSITGVPSDWQAHLLDNHDQDVSLVMPSQNEEMDFALWVTVPYQGTSETKTSAISAKSKSSSFVLPIRVQTERCMGDING